MLTIGIGVASAGPESAPVLVSPPAGIGFSWEWGIDDDDDPNQTTATWECPVGCSVVWEDIH
jgi:hypothetical protein